MQVDIELEKIIGDEVLVLAERIVSGSMADYAEYKFICGKIHGLRQSLECYQEAKETAAKR
jgi:hypothetical protein